MAQNGIALEEMLCFDIYGLQQSFGRLYAQLLEPLKITYPQYLVLVLLWESAPLSVSQLGQRLGLDSSTLTPLLKRMQQAGLVIRTRDTKDERRVLVSLSPAGQDLREKTAGVPKCIADATGMSEKEILLLRQQLFRLRGNIQDRVSAKAP
jgi:DNA-binding MarR family transcriptional regulator